MKYITVTTQAEFNALPSAFEEYTVIQIKDTKEWVCVNKAMGNSTVKAMGNSTVKAMGNSTVEAWDNSTVEAMGNSTVKAMGNSTVKAWGNSTVEAMGNSTVKAWGNSTVEAWDNSTVEAWDNSTVHGMADGITVLLWSFAVCFKVAKLFKVTKKSKTATVIKPTHPKNADEWLEKNGIKPTAEVVLFKRVSHDYKTQEGTPNETVWKIGSTLEHPNWQPDSAECGPGKFHACSRTWFCDEFRSNRDDRYIAIEIAKKDLHVWKNNPGYPHKIAFRKGKVLHEVDNLGRTI
ncbi:MAG TPA: hypothetical protein VJ836_00625 [Candidatus Saccharimonadales bacterium]|nr:hypothetical protein [Candidatus Saccharimonadales bacterium]